MTHSAPWLISSPLYQNFGIKQYCMLTSVTVSIGGTSWAWSKRLASLTSFEVRCWSFQDLYPNPFKSSDCAGLGLSTECLTDRSQRTCSTVNWPRCESCYRSHKVSHEWLETHWEDKRTSNRINVPLAPKAITAAAMMTNRITSLRELLHYRTVREKANMGIKLSCRLTSPEFSLKEFIISRREKDAGII